MHNQTNESKLANEFVELSVEHKPHCIVEFHVKASPLLTQRAYQNAIKSVAKETTVPGFRKGKAPEEMIKKTFKNQIDKKWEQLIGEEAFAECDRLAKTPVLNQQTRIHFKMKEHSMDGAEMTFQFESEPLIPELDLSSLKLETLNKEPVGEEKLEEIIHRIRTFFAKWEEVNERAAQALDFVTIDLDLIEDDKTSPVFHNTRLEIKAPQMANWMREIVTGMSVGESKEGLSEIDEDASDEDKQNFKPKKVKITLNKIESPILPVVDDEFAQKLLAETAEIMRERLMTLLTKQAEDEVRNQYRDQLSTLLLEHAHFEVPGSLLYTEIQHRSKQLFESPSFKKRYQSLSEDEKKEEFKKVEKQAIDALKLFYICRKVLTDNNIRILPSDLTQEIHSPLDAMFADKDLAKVEKTEAEKNLLMSRILLSKAQDFLIDKILK